MDVYTTVHACKNPIFYGYIILHGFIVGFANPLSREKLFPLLPWLEFTIINSILFIVFYACVTILAYAIAVAYNVNKIQISPIIITASIFTQIASEIVGSYIFNYKSEGISTLLMSISIIVPIALIGSIVYFKYIHSIVMRNYVEPEFPQSYIAQNTTGENMVGKFENLSNEGFFIVSGKKYPIANLLHIKAERNYIKITWENGSAFLRARLSDVTDQLLGNLGIQAHRSCWVSRNGISNVNQNGSSLTLIAKDNAEIAVARSRKGDVEAWLRQNGLHY
jgi:hypothetical protein